VVSQNAEQIPWRRHRLTEFHTYDVSADELDQIRNDAMAVGSDLNFACVTGAVFVSFLIAITAADMKPGMLFQGFLVVVLVSGVAGVFFGFRAYRGRGRGLAIFERIRSREVGPLGEDGKEIRPSDLDKLQGQEPSIQEGGQ
jgi:hypothetical protein